MQNHAHGGGGGSRGRDSGWTVLSHRVWAGGEGGVLDAPPEGREPPVCAPPSQPHREEPLLP